MQNYRIENILDKIQNILREADFLVHNFYNLKNDRVHRNDILYDMDDFIRYQIENKKEYILIIDRNIFDYIIKSKNINNLHHKGAIALIMYCQYLNIIIEPNLAIYEKFIRSKNIKEASKEHAIFKQIHNGKKELADFIYGDDELILYKYLNIQLLPYNAFDKNPTHWSMLYLSILVLCDIFYDKKIKQKDKFKTFHNYIEVSFVIIIPVYVYAIFLFSDKAYKGIMKFNPTTNKNKKKDIENMTWDLYTMKTYYEKLIKKENNTEYLLASNDKLLQEMLEVCIKVGYQDTENIDIDIKEFFNVCIDLIYKLKQQRQKLNLPKLENKFICNEIEKYENVFKIKAIND